MPGEVTQVIMEAIKARIDSLEKKLDDNEAAQTQFYRIEGSKIDVMNERLQTLITHLAEDRSGYRKLEARILKCETQLISLKADIERKFLKWVAISAAISGGAGASVLKAISLFGG